MSEEFGPWIEHDGLGCPPQVVGRVVRMVLVAPDHEAVEIERQITQPLAVCEIWLGARYGWRAGRALFGNGTIGRMAWVTRYRIKRPPALQQLVDLVERLPEPVQVEVVQ